MVEADIIIVGGGPAGSTCAWGLRRHGIESIVLDAVAFPRSKLCAGWITPDVVRHLEIDPAAYPHGFVTFKTIHAEYFGRRSARRFTVATTQHSIRRYEFDAWLLQRSGARVYRHHVSRIRPDGDGYVIDDAFRCRYLVGAGGTHCPVFRALFKDVTARSSEYQVAALEEEFAYDYADPNCYLWFSEAGLVGYAWYVPKGNGWVNVGLGGFSPYLKEAALGLHDHWGRFAQKLAAAGLVRGHAYQPKGHTYYIRERAKTGVAGRAYLVGDAAGLATRDLAEGIGPAVESGLRAADAIATGRLYSLDGMTTYSLLDPGLGAELAARWLDRRGVFFRDRVYARHWREKERAAVAASEYPARSPAAGV